MFDDAPAKVLVVDDNRLNRKKLKLAVQTLGLVAEVAEDGTVALEMWERSSFDLVLLDLLMPVMDGFEVLSILKENPAHRDIPVIVISDLEGEAESVSRAISLGAEDFLPKGFDPIILNARLEASLRKKRFRDQELEYFQRINSLTDAARSIETGEFDPSQTTRLDKEAEYADPIGRLATVFRGMASEIHAREVRLLERIRLLQCSLILIVAATASGVTPALSRMASGMGSTPIGMAVWVFALAAGLCLLGALVFGKFTKPTPRELVFLIVWGFLVGALQQVGVYIFAAEVEATYLTMIMALQGLFVFSFAALTGNEKPSGRRVAGLIIGFLGIAIALYARFEVGSDIALFWLFGAIVIPIIYAVETLGLAAKRPTRIHPLPAVGFMFGIATVFVVPMSLLSGQWMQPGALSQSLVSVIILLGLATVFANLALVFLVDLGGAVFSSQVAYARVLAGIFWGMLLLGERLNWAAWLAIGFVLVGMYLVETKGFDKPVKIKRQYPT